MKTAVSQQVSDSKKKTVIYSAVPLRAVGGRTHIKQMMPAEKRKKYRPYHAAHPQLQQTFTLYSRGSFLLSFFI